MTTMFVQLRRVVYLLVLLQCCLDFVHAGSDESQTRVEPEDVRFLKEWFKEAEKAFTWGVGCFSLWGSEVEKCGENSKLAKSATEKSNADVEMIKKMAAYQASSGTSTDDYRQKSAEVKSRMESTKDTIGKAWLSAVRTGVMEFMCTDPLGNMRHLVNDLNDTRVAHTGELDKRENKTQEIEDLVENSKEIYIRLVNLTANLSVTKVWSGGHVREANTNIQKAKKAVDDIITEFAKKCGGTAKTECEEKLGELRAIKTLVDGMTATHNKKGAGDVARRELVEAQKLESKKWEVAKEDLKKEREEKKKQEQQAREAKEQMERERAQKAREAEEQKAKEAQEQMERERAQKAIEAQEQMEKERAQKDREAQEQKEREVQAQRAREAQVEKEKEQLERAAEETRKKAAVKKNDSSISPALVHSPLLLILLSVLGSTLVC